MTRGTTHTQTNKRTKHTTTTKSSINRAYYYVCDICIHCIALGILDFRPKARLRNISKGRKETESWFLRNSYRWMANA